MRLSQFARPSSGTCEESELMASGLWLPRRQPWGTALQVELLQDRSWVGLPFLPPDHLDGPGFVLRWEEREVGRCLDSSSLLILKGRRFDFKGWEREIAVERVAPADHSLKSESWLRRQVYTSICCSASRFSSFCSSQIGHRSYTFILGWRTFLRTPLVALVAAVFPKVCPPPSPKAALETRQWSGWLINSHISQRGGWGPSIVHPEPAHTHICICSSVKWGGRLSHLAKDLMVPAFCDSETLPPPQLLRTTFSINKPSELYIKVLNFQGWRAPFSHAGSPGFYF